MKLEAKPILVRYADAEIEHDVLQLAFNFHLELRLGDEAKVDLMLEAFKRWNEVRDEASRIAHLVSEADVQ